MKHRVNILLMSIFIISIICGCVSADMIVEPPPKTPPIYIKADCQEYYTACGYDGKIKLYASPYDAEVKCEVENGKEVLVTKKQVVIFGRVWAYCEYPANAPFIRGWVPLKYLNVPYSNEFFMEDYASDIKNETYELDTVPYAGQEILVYLYPGSLERTEDSILLPDDTKSPMIFEKTYVDKEGRKWGYSNNFFRRGQRWICVDNPTADHKTLYPEGSSVEYKRWDKVPNKEIKPQIVSIIIGWVCTAIVLISVTIILLIKNKKRSEYYREYYKEYYKDKISES